MHRTERDYHSQKEQKVIGFKLKAEKEMWKLGWTYTKVHQYEYYGKQWTYTHTGP